MKTLEAVDQVKEPRAESRAHLYGILAVLTLAAALRFYQLGSESLWIDEGFSLRDAARPDLLRETRPLYFLFLSQWVRLGAIRSEWLLRLPSAIFGIAGVWMLYAVGRRLIGRSAALLASFFMAISVLHVNHSQEVRWYSLVALLSLLATYCLIRSLEEHRSRYVAGYAISGLAMLLTFPLSVFVLVAQGLFLLLYARSYRRTSLVLIGVLMLVAAAWIPWMLNNMATASAYSEGYTSIIERPTAVNLVALMGRFFLYKWSDPGRIQAAGALGFSALVTLLALSGLRGFRTTDLRLALIWLWLVVPVAAMIVVSYKVANVWKPSYLIAASPAFLLLVAHGIRAMRRPGFMAVSVAAITLLTLGRLGVYYVRPTHPQWRAVLSYVQAHELPGDVIGVYSGGNRHVFRYYYRGTSPWAPLGTDLTNADRLSGWTPEKVRDLLAGYPLSGRRFWLVFASHTYAGGFHIINYMKEHYRVRDHRGYFEVEVFLFDARGRPLPRESLALLARAQR